MKNGIEQQRLDGRVEVLSLAVHAVCGVLTSAQSKLVADSILAGLALAKANASEPADEAASVELVGILRALRQSPIFQLNANPRSDLSRSEF